MLFSAFLVILGLGVLYGGGEILVRCSVVIAERCGLSRLVIGLLIVGFGTSMPEMLVAVRAALGGLPGIALGNVVGSNIANVMLVVGTAAVLVPMSGWGVGTRRGAFFALLSAVLLYGMSFGDMLYYIHGVIMLGLLAGWLVINYRIHAKTTNTTDDAPPLDRFDTLIHDHVLIAPILALLGIVLLSVGAEILISGAVDIARLLGVSEVIIGLSLVAFATSLPELAAAVISALKRESDLIIGGIIGSNIFNILAVLGVTTLISPIDIDPRINRFDLPLVLATSGGLLMMLGLMQGFGRRTGAVMLVLYLCYMVMLAMQAGG